MGYIGEKIKMSVIRQQWLVRTVSQKRDKTYESTALQQLAFLDPVV